jgi:hypothetical protein
MNNELNDEKIKPKSEHYFLNKLLYNQAKKSTKKPRKSYDINNKYKSLTHKNKSLFNNSDNGNNNDFDIYKFKNRVLRDAISYSSNKKKFKGFVEKRRIKIKKKLNLLEKDIDLYSPIYKRLLSAQLFKKQNEVFNKNKTYENLIKNYLFSEKKDIKYNQNLILKKKSITNITNNMIKININDNKNNLNYQNNIINTVNSDRRNYIIRPKTTRINSNNYNNIIKHKNNLKYFLMYKPNINKEDIFKINIINLSLEKNNISNKLAGKNKNNKKINNNDDFNKTFYKRNFPLTEKNYFFNNQEKELKELIKKINFKKKDKKHKKNLYNII